MDSWGGMTAATSALLYRDGKYVCTKHDYASDSPTLCPQCERDFQEQREALRQKRESVNQKLQDMGEQDILAELQDSLQKWKPAAERDEYENDTRGIPRPHESHQHFAPKSPSPPIIEDPMNVTALATVPPVDALTMQIQGLQRMQDWMLYQKEQECQELRKRLEDILLENSSLRVENARLSEKLTQQEQRMQHELKLIKMAHQQRLKKEQTAAASSNPAATASRYTVSQQNSTSSSKSTGQLSEDGDLPSLQSPTRNNLPVGLSFQKEIEIPMERPSPVITPNIQEKIKANDVTPSSTPSVASNPTSPLETINVGPSTVPLEENITMGSTMPTASYQRKVVQKNATTPKISPPKTAYKSPAPLFSNNSKVSFADDNASVAQTVASSTFGEDRQYVENEKILDPYGDQGSYTGMVLKSTGMPHGKGKMLYTEDNRTFDGEWRHGRWHGHGVATFSNGDRYEGEYRFDQRHGQGTYSWNDGRRYSGQFSEDKRHGRGIFYWPDSATYEGEFRHGQRDGHGVYKFSDGGKYEGGWKDGVSCLSKHGNAFTCSVYFLLIIMQRYEGYGLCVWSDGRSYKGNWKNGMAHGHGVETFADGRVRHEGMWKEDEPVL